jgi:Golgi SNAP receptor complex protein 2
LFASRLSAARQMRDVLSSIGLSDSLLKVIDRRQRLDAIIVYGGMLLTLLLLVLAWWYFRS